MKNRIITGLAALAVLAGSPAAAMAHEGHAGDHGWLFGALQPLLALDHFLAGLFIAGAGALLFAGVGMIARAMRSRPAGVTRNHKG